MSSIGNVEDNREAWNEQGVITTIGDQPVWQPHLDLQDEDGIFDRIKLLGTPTDGNHAVSKDYVDSKFTSGSYDATDVAITGGSASGLTSVETKELKLPNADDTFFCTLKNAPLIGFDTIFQFPPDNGTSGYVLTTDGLGVTSWQASPPTTLVGAYRLTVGSVGGATLTNSATYFDGSVAVDKEFDLPQDLRTDANATFTSTTCVGYKLNGTTSGQILIMAQAITTNHILVLPPANGAGFMKNDGSGVLTYSESLTNSHTISVGSNGLTVTNDTLSYDGSQGIDHKLELPQNLTVGGTPTFVSVTNTSDARKKRCFESLGSVLGKIDSIEPQKFKWKKDFHADDSTQIGLMAQEIQKEFPEAVTEREGVLRMNNAAVTAILLKAIKELKEEVAELKFQSRRCVERQIALY